MEIYFSNSFNNFAFSLLFFGKETQFRVLEKQMEQRNKKKKILKIGKELKF